MADTPFKSLRNGNLGNGNQRGAIHSRQSAEYELISSERRAKISTLYKAHLTQREIATELGISQSTVRDELKAIIKEYRETYMVGAEEWVPRELADLDSMERDCALQFSATKHHVWLLRRIQIKERRAKMLGLDAPTKIDIRGWLAEQMRAAGATEQEAQDAVNEVERMMRENPVNPYT